MSTMSMTEQITSGWLSRSGRGQQPELDGRVQRAARLDPQIQLDVLARQQIDREHVLPVGHGAVIEREQVAPPVLGQQLPLTAHQQIDPVQVRVGHHQPATHRMAFDVPQVHEEPLGVGAEAEADAGLGRHQAVEHRAAVRNRQPALQVGGPPAPGGIFRVQRVRQQFVAGVPLDQQLRRLHRSGPARHHQQQTDQHREPAGRQTPR
nr:hypothetical protein [Hydrogenophaga sp. IBVHS2]